jgi:hypothetical protein
MPRIGPRFPEELKTNGLDSATVAIAWNTETGDLINGEALTPEQRTIWDNTLQAHDPSKPPVPENVSDRQFYQQLAVMGEISEQEALNAVSTGQLPGRFNSFVNGKPQGQQWGMKMKLQGANALQRHDQLIQDMANSFGWSKDHVDQIFIEAAKIV